jgi:hypothetical protein
MLEWTKAQWDAFGRHIITAATSAFAALVLAGVLTPAQSVEYLGHLTVIVTSLIAIGSLLLPIYAAFKAARSASPEHQAAQTVKNLEAGVPLNGKRDQLIEAVANQLKAEAISSNKVK